VSFRNDVMPVFLRGGCNAGGCHGAARGKDGFRLGLFGYDPAGDHHRLTREQAVRRINVALPDDSLLLTKVTGAVPHTGGKKFEPDSSYAKTLRAWIAAGGSLEGVEEAAGVAKNQEELKKSEERPIKPAERVNSLVVVESGVKPGERIVVEGLQRIRPGIKVKAELVPLEDPKAAAEGSSAPVPAASAPSPAASGG